MWHACARGRRSRRGGRRVPRVGSAAAATIASLALLVATPRFARADTLDDLLRKGEVTLLETLPDGRLKQATCIARVDVPLERVWSTLTDFAAYKDWMPQVRTSSVVSTALLGTGGGTHLVIDWTLAVVGPDVSFRQEADVDPIGHRVYQHQVSGALPGSYWIWELERAGDTTIVRRTVRNNVVDSNWVVKQVEDENHTLDYGINSAVGVIEVRGLKRRLGVP